MSTKLHIALLCYYEHKEKYAFAFSYDECSKNSMNFDFIVQGELNRSCRTKSLIDNWTEYSGGCKF